MFDWSPMIHHRLEQAFAAHGLKWDDVIKARVAAYMAGKAGERRKHLQVGSGVYLSARQLTGANQKQVAGRIASVVRMRLGLDIADNLRAARRAVLRDYALAGIRTISEIEAADAGK